MSNKSVLVVENEDLQRRSIHRQLEWSGFEVESAGDAVGARRVVEARFEPFDVVVLDMRLEGDDVTGADLGLEFRQRPAWRSWPAEFLINSAYSDEAYYVQALKLGAAAYLRKNNDQDDLPNVVDHVRVLALCRALSIDRPGLIDRIRSIAVSSRSRDEAIDRFCSEFICGELSEALPVDHLVLLTESGRTRGFPSRSGLPKGEHPIYETLQALTHGKAGWTEPFVLKAEILETVRFASGARPGPLLRELDRAAFVPLSLNGNVRLAVGLLPADASATSAQQAEHLVQLVGTYLSSSVLRHLVEVTVAFSKIEQRRRDILRVTAKDCLYIGQEVAASLSAAIDLGEIREPGPYVRKLQALGTELIGSGELLGELARTGSAGESDGMATLLMREVVQTAWTEVSRPLAADERELLDLEGNCRVQGRPDHLHLAVSRILQWMVQRWPEVPPASRPRLSVHCAEEANGPQVVFEDNSVRLPKRLRDRLLEPFSSAPLGPLPRELAGPGRHFPLYLAKALVEEGCLGRLEDRTDDMPGEIGHRLVMRLPAAARVAVAEAA